MRKTSLRNLSSLVLALGIGCSAIDGGIFAPSVLSRTTSDVALKLRRSPGRVDVVINGLGMNARAVSQRSTNERWTARLTDIDLGDDENKFLESETVNPGNQSSIAKTPFGIFGFSSRLITFLSLSISQTPNRSGSLTV